MANARSELRGQPVAVCDTYRSQSVEDSGTVARLVWVCLFFFFSFNWKEMQHFSLILRRVMPTVHS